MEDNSHAGQGAVLLDIGGDVGALILTMPAALAGEEIEIRPLAARDSAPAHAHSEAHSESHSGAHSHGHSHGEAHNHLVHVGVVGRPIAGELIHSAVFSALPEGQYELYVRPDGPVMLTETVRGGEVTMADWPS